MKKKAPPIAPFSMSFWYNAETRKWNWSVHEKKNVVKEGSSGRFEDAEHDVREAFRRVVKEAKDL